MIPFDRKPTIDNSVGYVPEVAAVEYFCRPLWGVLSLLANATQTVKDDYLRIWHQKNAEKFFELHPATTKNRQIVVEMTAVAFGMIFLRETLQEQFDDAEIKQLTDWLQTANDVDYPQGNWLFFSVIINLALKLNGFSYSQAKIDDALAALDRFYLGDGWYSDGDNQQRDYYVSFAFHFYGLIYATAVEDEWAQKFRERSQLFAKDFIYWFDSTGRSLPFGRSLTYRFAHVAFWSMFIVSGEYQRSQWSLGELKGVILRNFRWWSKHDFVYQRDHLQAVGYGYPNLVMSEDYNSPASPMWSFKAFSILLLPAEHAFWQVKEEPFPNLSTRIDQPHAGFKGIFAAAKKDRIVLSNRQFSANPLLLHRSEKYSKFAYSTLFGFNVTRDNGRIELFAADSTLALALKGTNQFFSRNEISSYRDYPEYSVSQWEYPNVAKITTYLIPLTSQEHIRLHEVTAAYPIELYEGGFPIHKWYPKYDAPRQTTHSLTLAKNDQLSGISDLLFNRSTVLIPQSPNANLIDSEKTAIPALYAAQEAGTQLYACGVIGGNEGSSFSNAALIESKDSYRIRFSGDEIFIKKEFFL